MHTRTNPLRVEAKSVDQAIAMACVRLNVGKEALEYKVIKEPKAGLISFFMGAKAEIEVWTRGAGGAPRDDRKGAESRHHRRDARSDNKGERHENRSDRNDNRGDRKPHREPREHSKHAGGRPQKARDDRGHREERRPMREERPAAEPLTPELQAQVEQDIRAFCKELCEKIVSENVNVASQMEDGKLKLEIDSTAVAEIIQSNTKFVESLEHILRKKPRNLKQELPFRIFIDSQGSRQHREAELIRMAQEKAEHVVTTGQKVILDYKSAADRKIIHMALEKDDRVYTKSIGAGSNRKLMILLSRGARNAAQAETDSSAD